MNTTGREAPKQIHLLRDGALTLIALTILTVFGVGVVDSHHSADLLGPGWWVTVILVTAFGKTAAIGYWFMNLKAAPAWLRYAYAAWVIVFAVATVLIAAW